MFCAVRCVITICFCLLSADYSSIFFNILFMFVFLFCIFVFYFVYSVFLYCFVYCFSFCMCIIISCVDDHNCPVIYTTQLDSLDRKR